MMFKSHAGGLVGSLAIATALTACGGAKTEVAPAPAGDAAVVATTAPSDAGAGNAAGAPASDSGPAAAPVGAAGGDVFVVDHVAMADQPCHLMGNTIMGRCAEADVAKIIGEAGFLKRDTEAMADAPCHEMDGSIMGKCSESDVKRLAEEIRAARPAAPAQP